MIKTMEVIAKCGNSFSADLIDEKNKKVFSYFGYVPDFFPPIGYDGSHGEHVRLIIDIETGKILNWETPAQEQMMKHKRRNKNDH